MPNFVVYDMTTYFSQQPGVIKCCPACGKSIVVTRIHPSRTVAEDLTHGSLIPVHDFSCLYECSTCHWWAIREGWGFRESSSELDFMIVGISDNEESVEQQPAPWRQIMQDEGLYDHAEPLPDNLGQLFIGGQRKR